MMRIYFSIIFLSVVAFSASAQSWMYKDGYLLDFKNRHEVNLFVGAAAYQGDMNGYSDENLSLASELNTALGLSYTLNVVNRFSVGLSYFTTKLSGNDANFEDYWHKKRNFSFTNQIHEFSLRFDYEPFQLQNSKFMPYVFGGVGIVTGDAKTKFLSSTESWDNRIAQDNQNKKNTSFAIPLGLGVRYYLSSKVSIKLEGSVRVGMNDYLDGVSISGNPDSNDSFGALGLGFTYGFGQAPNKEKVIDVKPNSVMNN
jgi:opacity protein-like surface antigen